MKKLFAIITFLTFLTSNFAWEKVGLDTLTVREIIKANDGNMYAVADIGDSNLIGVYKADSQGSSWTNVMNAPTLGLYGIYCITEDTSGNLYVGTQKTNQNASILKSTNKGGTWTETGKLPSTVTAVSTILSARDGTIYSGFYYRNYVVKSLNSGSSWLNITNTDFMKYSIYITNNFLETSDGTIYAAANIGFPSGSGRQAYILKTTDKGGSWTKVAKLIPSDIQNQIEGNHVTTLAKTSDGTLYAGTLFDFFKSTNDGNTWNSMGEIDSSGITNDIFIGQNGKIYVATSNGVYTSEDGANSWNKILGLDSSILSLYVADDLTIFAGTSDGVYKGYEQTTTCQNTISSCCTDSDCNSYCNDFMRYSSGHCTVAGEECTYWDIETCDDLNECTTNSCSPDNCVYENVLDGTTCTSGQCLSGVCTETITECPEGQLKCEGVCTDVNTDITNCGSCGNKCSNNQKCKTGKCILKEITCSENKTLCENMCVDTKSDTNNCGKCGFSCEAGQLCCEGGCRIIFCSSDEECENTELIIGKCLNAGTCNAKCNWTVLTCPIGLTDCDRVCANFSTHPLHCGSCNNACASGEECKEGVCVASALGCPLGYIRCDNICRLPCYNDNNCNDFNPLTKDTCDNPGTCKANCSHTTICPSEPECFYDSACDDNNPLTEDTCNNSRTCEAACIHTSCVVKCSTDTDCDDKKSSTTDVCVYPGTCVAHCSRTETGCPEGQIKCLPTIPTPFAPRPACTTPICSSDANCNDNNNLTIDTCLDAGTCNATCSNMICKVTCSSDADCDDANADTIDTCNSPKTCKASCSHTSIICIKGEIKCDGSCTTPTCSEDSDCNDKDTNTIDTCDNAGTCEAGCNHTPTFPSGGLICNGIYSTPRCSNDNDCTEEYVNTGYSCLNVGTCKAVCVQISDETCMSDIECIDENPCTNDICDGKTGKCVHVRQDGCVLGNKCMLLGERESEVYCALTNKWVTEKAEGKECYNNYECLSNFCVNSKCRDINEKVDSMQKFVNKLRDITYSQTDVFVYNFPSNIKIPNYPADSPVVNLLAYKWTNWTCPKGQLICLGQCALPACSSNNDCDDGDTNTVDTCLNPSSCVASCKNSQPSLLTRLTAVLSEKKKEEPKKREGFVQSLIEVFKKII